MPYSVDQIGEFLHFDSLMEMVDYADSVEGCSWGSDGIGQEGFYGTSTYAEASELVRSGDPSGVRSLKRAMQIAADGMDSIHKSEPTMDVVGPIPITGAYCAGDPECMMTPADPFEVPVINLIVDANATAGVSAAVMRRRGAAILALAQRLEESGRSVAIFANCSNICSGGVHSYIVCLKKADAEFNLHSLSYAMTNISYFRRHGFRILEGSKGTSGHGGSIALTSIEGIQSVIGDIDLYFPCANTIPYSRYFKNQDTANDYVLKIARESGIID